MSQDGSGRINGDRINGLVFTYTCVHGVFLGVISPTDSLILTSNGTSKWMMIIKDFTWKDRWRWFPTPKFGGDLFERGEMINQDYWEYFPDVINGDSKWCFCCDLQNLCPTHSHCTGPNVTVKSMQVIFKVPNRDEIVMQICSPLFSRRVRVKTADPRKNTILYPRKIRLDVVYVSQKTYPDRKP